MNRRNSRARVIKTFIQEKLTHNNKNDFCIDNQWNYLICYYLKL